ncbi:MAG TPA: glycosyltransferase family 39 protein [Anaerolineales bacterium]|nr:glycosyltransferase family 39 protein [Anaerolineales bacterium]HMR98871.1 glycosyltransferase family 39 protein [Anaerolineales bacterium]HNQ94334.1 glycosyltransferase family 39 protein [Anaerolineales bacterium]HNS60266.1 glycosyltransferase family 39 protein [Anaerolineales bacterium]
MDWKAINLRRLLVVPAFFSLLALGIYNQPYYPVTWFDEGLALQGALNLVNHGQYAMRSVEGFRTLDQPLIANGPGLIIPIAIIFKIFGVGLLQARILAAVFFLATALLFFRISSALYSAPSALVSVFLLLSIPDEGFLFYGRQALGNVPALMYFFIGFLFFLALGKKKQTRYAILSGLFFGLALVTKGQYWIFVPALGLAVVADYFYYKQIRPIDSMIVLFVMFACAALWLGVQYKLVGAENFDAHVAALDSSAEVTILAFRPGRIPGNIWYLIRSGFLFFVGPGLLLSFLESRQRNMVGLGKFMLAVFVTVWVIWFCFASVGWPRYTFEAFSIGLVFSGEAFYRIYLFIRKSWNLREKRLTWQQILLRASSLFLLAGFAWAGNSLFQQVRDIDVRYDATPEKFADYIVQNLPADAVIESWEWEIDLLTPDHTYHHPANRWVDLKTAETQFGETTGETYDPMAYHPEYLIDGPFSKWTGMYTEFLAGGCCVSVVTVENYTLYKINYREE